MQTAPIPFDEIQRLDAVYNLNILDSKPEERFDRLTRLTQHIFDVPSAFISLVDKERVWFKAKVGYEEQEEPRDISFCGHTICNPVTDKLSSRLLEVKDARDDDRFKDNIFVTNEGGLRYYMGFVLQSMDERNVGTFCIMDTRPRTFSVEEKNIFIDIGMMAEKELNQKSFACHLIEDARQTDSANKFLDLSSKLRIIQKHLDGSLRDAGISFKEWCVLNAIMELEYATPRMLSKSLNISPSLITRRIEKLEIKNLVNRWHSNDGDRRFVHVTCSDKGIKLWRKGILEANELQIVHLKDIICLS